MICDNCKNQTRVIRVIDGIEYCPSCAGFSQASGSRIDGITTRGSFRVRSENIKYEKDFLLPHRYDKGSKKIVPNEDFGKVYPEKYKEIIKGEKK